MGEIPRFRRFRGRLPVFSLVVFLAILWTPCACPGKSFQIPGLYQATGPLPAYLAPVGAKQLPVLEEVIQGLDDTNPLDADAANGNLTVNQTESKAVIHWRSFNVGEEASVRFDQQGNRDWIALNRIFDKDPSQILGSLTADGRVYLINQNGILFGPNAQINVHSLVASSLNVEDDDLWSFRTEDYNDAYDPSDTNLIFPFQTNSPGTVSNYGVIEAGDGGFVFLIGPSVENRGSVLAPNGQIGLVAGTEVTLTPATDERWTILVDVTQDPAEGTYLIRDRSGTPGDPSDDVAVDSLFPAGLSLNAAPDGNMAGTLESPAGQTGMYGRYVNQEGFIRSVSAVKRGGAVELVATGELEQTGTIDISSLYAEEGNAGGLSDEDLTEIQNNGGLNAGRLLLEGPEIHLEGLVLARTATALKSDGQELKGSTGTFTLRQGELGEAEFDAIYKSLKAWNLNHDVTMEALTGDLSVGPETAYSFDTVTLTAAAGTIHHRGTLVAPTVTLEGNVVNQEGLILSTRGFFQDGNILLRGTEKVYTAPGSLTAVLVTLDDTLQHDSFELRDGSITLESDGLIDHQGEIIAPSGIVTLEAGERVFLENGSLIDVSGAWIDERADAAIIEATLNSQEMRDEYGQKGGSLQGEIIRFNALLGSAVGDLSGSLTAEQVTALEQATGGGEVIIKAGDGDIIMKSGAVVDLSGGGWVYEEGYANTTKVRVGNRIYDINDMPSYAYAEVFGSYIRIHRRATPDGFVDVFTDSYDGLYFGGANALNEFWAEHVEGGDAGTLRLVASRIVLDGTIHGETTQGIYQTEPTEPEDDEGNQTATGVKEPRGGYLILGDADAEARTDYKVRDYVLEEVVITNDVNPVPDDFNAESPYPADRGEATIISADVINQADLSNVEIFTNTTFTVEEDTTIELRSGNVQEDWLDEKERPNGRFWVTARSIQQLGELRAPSGSVLYKLKDNITTDTTELPERIYLADGSAILAGGESLQNAMATQTGESLSLSAHIHGGTVQLLDETANGDGVFIQSGAVVDVSGGYDVGEEGEVTAGRGGTLEIEGPTMAIDGELRGHALAGAEGGTIKLHVDWLTVAPTSSTVLPDDFEYESPVPEDFMEGGTGIFVLAEDRLARTGFAHIELRSSLDLNVLDGVTLQPSLARKPLPDPSGGSAEPLVKNTVLAQGDLQDNLIFVDRELAGPTSILLEAGSERTGGVIGDAQRDKARIWIAPSAMVLVATEGEIQFKAPAIDVAGTLEAPAGLVQLSATRSEAVSGAEHALVLRSESRILATGYNRLLDDAVAAGLPAAIDPLDGGEVILEAELGDLLLESGSRIDVSGSEPTEVWGRSGTLALTPYETASGAGSVELVFANQLLLEGELLGNAHVKGLPGGSLTISKKSDADLELNSDELYAYVNGGFDALTFRTWGSLVFADDLDLDLGRSLTLDAQEIRGAGGSTIRLHAPWIRLVNLRDKYAYQTVSRSEELDQTPAAVPAPGTASLSLSGEWIELQGSLLLSGFEETRMEASRDIRVMDELYANYEWGGALTASGDLSLQADRIYPALQFFPEWRDESDPDTPVTAYIPSDFVLAAPDGSVTILPGTSSSDATVFAAGGSLTVQAREIFHQGTLLAPLGRIILQGPEADGFEAEKIVLANGSILSTTAAGSLPYGFIDGQELWREVDKQGTFGGEAAGYPSKDMEAPQKGLTLQGIDILVGTDALADASGGGNLFAYGFQSGLAGSEDPLKQSGRLFVLPENDSPVPGETIVLEGPNVSDGPYTVLPEAFAFLPGTIVLEETEKTIFPGESFLSEEHDPVTSGYAAYVGAEAHSLNVSAFALREPADVLREGTFTIWEGAFGDAGDITVRGRSVGLHGTLAMSALPLYRGGILELSAEHVAIGPDAALPPGQRGLTLDPALLDDLDLEEIGIGFVSETETITQTIVFEEGILTAPTVTLTAGGDVTLESGAEIHAVDEEMRLESFIYKHTYDPDLGLALVQPQAIQVDPSTGEMTGTVLRHDPSVERLLSFHTEGGAVVWDLNEEADQAGELEDLLLQEDYLIQVAGGFGLATVESKTGFISNETGSVIHATDEVRIDGTLLPRGGDIYADNSRLTLASSSIVFLPELPGNYKGELANALYLTESIWESLNAFETITLAAETDLVFMGDLEIDVIEDIWIEADRIVGLLDTGGNGAVTIASGGDMRIYNPDGASDGFDPDGAASITLTLFDAAGDPYDQLFLLEDVATLTLQAGSSLSLGKGQTVLDGFSQVDLEAARDIRLEGQGSLLVDFDEPEAGGVERVLNLKAARVTTSFFQDDTTDYELTAFTVNAGEGRLGLFTSGSGAAGESSVPGGTMELLARRIDLAAGARIEAPSGHIELFADETIKVGNGAQILARGEMRATTLAGEEILDFQPGGSVVMETGTGSIEMAAGSLIDVSMDLAPEILDGLSESDLIFLAEAGALDAGSVSLYSPLGGVNLSGEIRGAAPEDGTGTAWGRGGSFSLDTAVLDDFNALNADILAGGGFTRSVQVRARTGALDIQGDDVTASFIKLVADSGAIHLRSDLVSRDGDSGGQVELYAGTLLEIHDGSHIYADGFDGPGGQVTLAVAEGGELRLESGSVVDVSGGDGQPGGELYVRAYRDGSPSMDNVLFLNGEVRGAESIFAETVSLHPTLPDGSSLGNPSSYVVDPASVDTSGLETNGTAVHVLSGIEIRGAGDLTLETAQPWDLTDMDPGGEPGVLTLRAAGNLYIDQNIVDHPTDESDLPGSAGRDSWGYNLVAGADLTSADVMAVLPHASLAENQGNLVIEKDAIVYTESAPIRFASARDTIIGPGYAYNYMIDDHMAYSLATFDGDILGLVGGSMELEGVEDASILKGGAAVQTARGDISLDIRGSLTLDTTNGSAIRTTGYAAEEAWSSPEFSLWYADALVVEDWADPYDQNWWLLAEFYLKPYLDGTVPGSKEEAIAYIETHYPGSHMLDWPNAIDTDGDWAADATPREALDAFLVPILRTIQGDYWEYTDGGNIVIDVGGSVKNKTSGLGSAAWDRADYQGNLGTWAPSFEKSNLYLPTSGIAAMGGGDVTIHAGGSFFSQAGTFGEGDLRIFSGGDMDGRFLVRSGDGYLNALGNFGNRLASEAQGRGNAVELFDARIQVSAQGTVDVGAVLNPQISIKELNSTSNARWNLGYTESSSVQLRALRGDITLYGDSIFHQLGQQTLKIIQERVLPPSVSLEAGGDVFLPGTFALTPSRTGNLRILAGGSISQPEGKAIYMSDALPSSILGDHTGEEWASYYLDKLFSFQEHAATPIHHDDEARIEIKAGLDIEQLRMYLPKQAEIYAGRDIRNIYLQGQNVRAADITSIYAGRDLFFDTLPGGGNYNVGIELWGPGRLWIQAGNTIDLGTTQGISTKGDIWNLALPPDGADLVVIAGIRKEIDPEELDPLFDQLREAGIESGELRQAGDAAGAGAVIEEARENLIDPLFEGETGEGHIDMISSQMSTTDGPSSLYMISSGAVNVGKTTFFADEAAVQKTGIFTAGGGAINLLTVGDVNVNESRIMTFMGGDITIWSDRGNINAGRGAKSFVSADPPRLVFDPVQEKYVYQFEPPAVGSGIRALTFDPDGEGPLDPPPAGDIFLTAPEGVIDAGEAGIAGTNLFLTATEVLNAQNIEFTGTSIGVPSASGGAGSIGSLSGMGNLSEMGGMGDDTSSMASRRSEAAQEAEQLAQAFAPRWLDVKVISFDELEEGEEETD